MMKIDMNMKYLLMALFALICLYVLIRCVKGMNKTPPGVTEKSVPEKGKKINFYYSDGCPFCKKQKDIIEKEGLESKFNYVHCPDNKEQCNKAGVSGVPAFGTDSKIVAVGLQQGEELKKL